MAPTFRRSFLGQLGLAAAAIWMGPLGCTPESGETQPAPEKPVVRKSASALSAEEIDRFKRAFSHAVEEGYFNVFNDQHHDHHHQRNHGSDVLATSPITVQVNALSWGYRLLPWHRSFLLEAEKMLQAALRERNEAEGKDPAEADSLFLPYWDAAHDQALPDWVLELQPKGGKAPGDSGLPESHAGYGTAEGEHYDITFGRWPGQNPVFDTLHTPDYIKRILDNEGFVDFYNALDTNPEIVAVNFPKANGALTTLEQLLPDEAAVKTVKDGLSNPPQDTASQVAFTNALFKLGYIAAVETRKAAPDPAIVSAVKDVFSLFNFMPHVRMHLWAGGLHPENADIRGTVTYFNELTVDPVFWMLHAELDRIWYTWETEHDESPPLEGDDLLFAPLSEEQATFYGGGKTYSLDDLTDHAALAYSYDKLFTL